MYAISKAALGLLTGILLCAMPASAQITSVVDENGKRVFVNDDVAGPRSAGKSSSSVPAVRTASAGQARGTTARSYTREELERMAQAAAERHKVDPVLVRAVIEQESKWDHLAISYKGAQGLMQLMPGKAEELGVRDPFDPEQNLDGGVRYLRALLEKYEGDLDRALAAYNAGSGAVDRSGGVPNYRETKTYVQKITDSYFRPGSGRSAQAISRERQIYRVVDERGRLVFVNE